MFLDDYITTPSPSACMLHALNRFNFQLAGRFVAARKCLIPTTHYLHYHTYTTLRHQANTPVPDLPFPPAPAACLVHQRYLLVHTPCWVLQCMSCGARVVCLVALGCCVYLVHHRHVWCTKGILWMFGAPTVCFGAEYLWCTISHTEDTVYLPN